MSFLSPGYSYGNPFYRPLAGVQGELFIVNKGSVYSMLTNDFSIFKRVIDNSVLYRNILNNLEMPVTLVLPPDNVLPDEVKRHLLALDRAEATTLLSYHTIEKGVKWLDGHTHQTRHGGIILARVGNTLILPKGESKQYINLLSNGNYFVNGVVYVIDQPIIASV
jgi:hypothetical protein